MFTRLSPSDHGSHLGADEIAEVQDRSDVEHDGSVGPGEADELHPDGLGVVANLELDHVLVEPVENLIQLGGICDALDLVASVAERRGRSRGRRPR
ncbi:hypothetical protein [Micromonospora sp. WMMD980]|uniref:hypothetical protein n=1 Tax=Micromonospora sp. WMMD980 TaxID=3016088 RepID=UPI00241752B4|nr:hypothetical protein [Micromonospora sp. WMMD980]MDG4800908.1 hypothetical protein [Micromonospora sp. WMMD980]